MNKLITTTAFLMALTACYPVHAKFICGDKAEKIWVSGEIVSKKYEGAHLTAFIKYKKSMFHCRAHPLGDWHRMQCYDSEKVGHNDEKKEYDRCGFGSAYLKRK